MKLLLSNGIILCVTRPITAVFKTFIIEHAQVEFL